MDRKGLQVIHDVLFELHPLIKECELRLEKNTIINVTELIKDRYQENMEDFKVLTSQIGFIIDKSSFTGESKVPDSYRLRIFADDKINTLAQVNITDMLSLYDVNLTDSEYLSKCTFHFNRLYHEDQFDMIPSLIKEYTFTNK